MIQFDFAYGANVEFDLWLTSRFQRGEQIKRTAQCCSMLRFVLLYFRAFPVTVGGSMQHACDMKSGGAMERSRLRNSITGGCTVLSKTTYATLIVILTMEAASAQEDTPRTPSMPGYSHMRTQQEREKDRAIDRAYESTVKSTTKGAEKKNSDPWGDVRSTPPAAAKNKQQ